MKDRAWLWPAGLVALLVAGVGANVAFMVVATRDPSFAVEPDYYRKALAWDATMAQEARNEALGWGVSVATTPAGRRGHLRLHAAVADRGGASVGGATVTVEALHGARASQVVVATLAEEAPGRYATELPLRRAGLWELRFRVARGDDVFTRRLQQDLPGAP
jgi:nitrogen fixation protein FixH